jgi:hypothetical protein
MTAVGSTLLDLPARTVIGTVIKFRSPRSLRVRSGRITSISASGVRVISSHATTFFLSWGDLLEIAR